MNGVRNRLIGLASLIALLALTIGIPIGLWVFGSSALPAEGLSVEYFKTALSSPDDGSLFILFLLAVGWLAWATWALSVGMEILARVRGLKAPQIRGLGVQQRGASVLVGATLMLLLGGGIATAQTSDHVAQPGPATTISAPSIIATQSADTGPVSDASQDIPAHRTPASGPTVEVQSSDTLYSLAQKHLGDGSRYTELADLNRGVVQADGESLQDDNWISTGWVLHLPDDASVDHAAELGPNDIVVQAGDTLWDLAEQHLGDGSRHGEITDAHGDALPGALIKVGDVLRLPGGIHTPETPAPAPTAVPAPETAAPAPEAALPAPAGETPAPAPETAAPAPETAVPAPTSGGVVDSGTELGPEIDLGPIGGPATASPAPETAAPAPAPETAVPAPTSGGVVDSGTELGPEIDLGPIGGPAIASPAPTPETAAPAPDTELPASAPEPPAPAPAPAPAPETAAPAPETAVPAPTSGGVVDSGTELGPEIDLGPIGGPATASPAPETAAPAPAPETPALAPETAVPAPETVAPTPTTAAPTPEARSATSSSADKSMLPPADDVSFTAGPSLTGPIQSSSSPKAASGSFGVAPNVSIEALPIPGTSNAPTPPAPAGEGSTNAASPTTSSVDVPAFGVGQDGPGAPAAVPTASPDPSAAEPTPDQENHSSRDGGVLSLVSNQVSRQSSTGMVGVTALSAVALLAAVTLWRRRQAHGRRSGERAAVPAQDILNTENELADISDADQLDALKLALGQLGAAFSTDDGQLPDVRTVLLDGDLIEVIAADDDRLPAPWERTPSGSWILRVGDIPAGPIPVENPWPLLMPMGVSPAGEQVVMNLAELGYVSVHAAEPALSDVRRSFMVESSIPALGGRRATTFVGTGGDLVDAMADESVTYAASVTEAVEHLRAEHATDDPGAPLAHLVLLGRPATEDDIDALLDAAELVSVVEFRSTEARSTAPWKYQVDSDRQWRLTSFEGAALPVSPPSLSGDQYADIVNLVADARGPAADSPGTVDRHLSETAAATFLEDRLVSDDSALWVSGGDVAAPDSPAIVLGPTPSSPSDAASVPVSWLQPDLTRGVASSENEFAPAPAPAPAPGVGAGGGIAPEVAVLPTTALPRLQVRALGRPALENTAGVAPEVPAARDILTELAVLLSLCPGISAAALDGAMWPQSRIDRIEDLAERAERKDERRRSALDDLANWIGPTASGRSAVNTGPDGIALDEEVHTDWDQWQLLLDAGIAESSTEHLAAALALVDDAPLADTPDGRYAWAGPSRRVLAGEIADVAEELAARYLEADEYVLAHTTSGVGLAVLPECESLWRMAIVAAHLSGDRATTQSLIDGLFEMLDQLDLSATDETVDLLAGLTEYTIASAS
ncbi:LysM peptidoglycan-binding domain-containing protein [Rhodococcus hoagii]|nr:LysM peptidoglycan-binding domain-containing protein [Prescottella equi]NKS71713.1 LysM peptidoglycan-binding domain-containing protein [Prescottella equi]